MTVGADPVSMLLRSIGGVCCQASHSDGHADGKFSAPLYLTDRCILVFGPGGGLTHNSCQEDRSLRKIPIAC